MDVSNIYKRHNEFEERIKDKNIKLISDEDAVVIIEDVLDALMEVGNGISDECLHEQCDKLFIFRDKWLNFKIKENV